MLRLLPFDDGNGPRMGLIRGTDQVLDLRAVAPKTPESMDRILDGGPYFWDALAEYAKAQPERGQLLPLADVVAQPLMGAPRRVVSLDGTATQVLSVAAPDVDIDTTAPDHLIGIAAVLRSRCKDLDPATAMQEVAGFTVVSGLLQPGMDERIIVAAQMGPLLLKEGIVGDRLLARAFVDDEPVESLQTTGVDWSAKVAEASSELLRPRDLVMLCGERRNVAAPAEIRASLATAGHSVARLQMRLRPRDA